MEGFVLEHCQEPGEEGGQRLAPGDQGNPQWGKEGKTLFQKVYEQWKKGLIGTFLILHYLLSICGMPSFLKNISNSFYLFVF